MTSLLSFVKKSASSGDVRRGKVDASDAFDRWTDYLLGPSAARRGTEGSTDNPPGIIPNGHYRISRAHHLSWSHGFRVSGSAMKGVVIEQMTPDTPHFVMDGASYFDLEHITFLAGAVNSGPQLIVDWSGKYPNALKPQNSVLRRLAFVGARIGLAICPSGGAAQGDTIHIDDCYGERCGFGGQGAWIAIGSPGKNAMNALGVRITGGNGQQCFPDAIANWGGQPIVDGTSFQNQSGYGEKSRQIAEGGADLHSYCCTASWPRAANVRSESPVLSIGFKILRDCESYAAYCTETDFYAVDGVARWDNNHISLGRVRPSVGEGFQATGGRVTRPDWLDERPFQGNPEAYNSFYDGVGVAQGALTAPLVAGSCARRAWNATAGCFQ